MARGGAVSGSLVCPIFGVLGKRIPKTLKMGQTSDPETLVIHQKVTPGNNPEDFMHISGHPQVHEPGVKIRFSV